MEAWDFCCHHTQNTAKFEYFDLSVRFTASEYHFDILKLFLKHKFMTKKNHYKLFTFLSVDMEILTPWSGQVHPCFFMTEILTNQKLL